MGLFKKGTQGKVKRKKEKRNTKMSFLDFWDLYNQQRIYKNMSERKIIRDFNFYGDMNSVMSGKDNIAYIYIINGYPSSIEVSFRKTLRRSVGRGVKVHYLTELVPENINWNDPKMKRQVEIWDRTDSTRTSNANGRNSAVFETGDKQASDDRSQSMAYFYDATRNRGRKLFTVRQYAVVSGKRGTRFDDSVLNFEKEAENIGIRLERVTDNLTSFLPQITPTSYLKNKTASIRISTPTLSDEIISRFSNYEQGFVGKGSYILGLSVHGRSLVLAEPKADSTSAENWLFCGETGSGKSYAVKNFIIQLLARPEIVGTINDIEGNEYDGIAEFTANREKVLRINLSSKSGQYIDPVEIHLTGDRVLDEDMFTISKSFTLSVLKTYVGKQLLERYSWASTILKSALDNFYKGIGVDERDYSTWKRTHGKTQFDIFPYIVNYSPFGTKSVEEYVKECKDKGMPVNTKFLEARDEVLAQLNIYLSEEARKSHRYSNPVSIADLKDSKLVVLSFDMRGKSESLVDAIDMGLMQIYASQISTLRSIFALNQGKFNFKVWEELQRWGDFPDADEVLKVALSGGRKLGDINILVINRLREVVEHDKFSILESVQSFAIGAIEDKEVRHKLAERLSIPHLIPELDLIYQAKEQEEKGEEYISRSYDSIMSKKYSKAFVVGINNANFVLTKVVLPRELSETKLFKTGVDVKKEGV